MAVGALFRSFFRTRPAPAGPGHAALATWPLLLGAAAQVLALMWAYPAWDLPVPVPFAGAGGLLAALVLTVLSVPHWSRLARCAQVDGGIAPATAEALAPVAPLLGSIIVTCYWLGHCALAALALGMSLHAIGILAEGGFEVLPQILLGIALLAIPCLPGVQRLKQAVLVGTATAAVAALGWLLLSHQPLLPAGLPLTAMAFDGDVFGRASAWCAGLFLAGPSLCASEALLSLPKGAARRQGQGTAHLLLALAGTLGVLLLLLPELRSSLAAGVGKTSIAGRQVAACLALAAGGLALALSSTAARRAVLALFARPRPGTALTAAPTAVAPRATWLPGLLTGLAVLLFLVVRPYSWVFAGAGLAYFVALAAVAAVAARPAVLAAIRPVVRPAWHLAGLQAPRPGAMPARLAAFAWLGTALLGLQAWGVQALLAGLMMVHGGAVLHLVRGLRSARTRASVHTKLLAGMLLILALNGAGFLVVQEVLRPEDRAAAAFIEDVFTAVALLTVLVGVVLPAMIVHALTQAADAAERLALVAVSGMREGIDALGRGELEGVVPDLPLVRLETPFRDEIGRIATSINILQDDLERAVHGLDSARDKLRRSRAELFHQARHDSLTGLYNRRAFEEVLARLVDDRRQHASGHALLYLDLDQFKIVNDTCGHDAGDELLRQVSLLLAAQLRADDILARLGGDEFGVILADCAREHAIRIAEAMVVAVRELTFGWQDRLFRIGVSIGVVAFHSGATTLTELLSAADKSCYCAKEQGRNRLHAYAPDDDEISSRSGEMQWVSRIHAAMEEGRLCLYAQPIRSLRGHADTGHHELLLRMVDGAGDLVPPMAFIPAAERFGVMPLLDRWVVRAALQRLGELANQGDDGDFRSLALNLSGTSLTDESFLGFVKEQFRLAGVPHGRVWFEITEASATANLRQAKRFISELRTLGCRFGLDDFGAGLSSFGYLRQLEVDFLKIDGTFVQDMAVDPVDHAMVEAINRIGQLMGLRTIAEFVGDERTVQALREMGVDMVQGHGVAAPVPFTHPPRQPDAPAAASGATTTPVS